MSLFLRYNGIIEEAELRGLRLFNMHGKGLAAIDWNTIRAEYSAGGISQRALAAKHGATYSAVKRKALLEHWGELRKAAAQKTGQKVAEKTAAVAADNASKLEKARGLLIDQALDAIEAIGRPVRVQTMSDLKALVEIVEKLAAVSGGSDEALKRLDVLIGKIDDAAKQ